MITYSQNDLTAEELGAIRASIGFSKIEPEQAKASIDGSTLVLCARDGSAAVGMARLIWDTGSVALIHGVFVRPEYQRRGIEAELVTRICDYLREKLRPGFGIQVDVKAWGEQTDLFETVGFQLSMPEKRGVPMHICLTE